MIEAFHREFLPSEPVQLAIKTGMPGADKDALYENVIGQVMDLKASIGLYSDVNLYKPEFLITEPLSQEGVWQLHKMCHCFVMPSSCESMNRPAIEAMMFGNQVISTSALPGANFHDIIPPKDATKMLKERGRNSVVPHVSIKPLMEAMRLAYSLREQSSPTMKFSGFGYKNMGEKIERALWM